MNRKSMTVNSSTDKTEHAKMVLVLNGSPTGENSITLQTALYIANAFPDA